jgi:formate-nitrite transporter family protein
MAEPLIHDPTRPWPAQHAHGEAKAKEHHIPEGELMYRAIRQDGDEALARTNRELAWSGIAAGLSMGLSLITEGLLRAHVPEVAWAPLITKFGYTVGFLITTLGRQLLFTEQTITAVLPVLSKDRPNGTLTNLARLWAIVLAANVAGTALVAAAAAWTTTFAPEVHAAFSHIGHAALSHDAATIFVGFLIATMIWMMPASGGGRVLVVVLMTYVVGLGAFSHVIAGTTEGLYVVFAGERSLGEFALKYFVPTFLGNSVGGVVFVALLAHAQHAPDESS